MMQKRFLPLLITALLFPSKTLRTMAPEVIQKIGTKIWLNETGGQEEYIVFWSEKESFPSLGIGHNIWLPEGSKITYTQGFPTLCAYLKNHDVTLPNWLEAALKKGAPWKNRADFYNDHTRREELRNLLLATIPLQAQFMVDRLHQQLSHIIDAAPTEQRNKIEHSIDLMLASPLGIYSLIDYLNFKGDGLNPKEEHNGQRWGLLAVLQDMPDSLTSENVTKAFTLSAAKKLIMLIEASAPAYKSFVFLGGWMKRLGTYTKEDF